MRNSLGLTGMGSTLCLTAMVACAARAIVQGGAHTQGQGQGHSSSRHHSPPPPPPPPPHVVHCSRDCTAALQAALFSNAPHVIIHPPAPGVPVSVGSPTGSCRLVANGTDQLVEFAPGMELVGFLNYSASYSPALVTLDISHATNLTIRGNGAVLRKITSYVSGRSVVLDGLNFIDPGWDGLYARGVVGLVIKDCLFDRYTQAASQCNL